MKRIAMPAIATTLAAALLVGCGGQTTVVQPTYRTSYDPAMLTYAASKGGMRVDIVGTPFAGVDGDLARTVTERLSGSVPGVAMPFFTQPPSDYTSPYRVVMLFDPAPGANLSDICTEASAQPTAATPGRVKVSAALCSTEQTITRVSGRVHNVESPGDRGFGDLVAQIGRGLFLPTNPDMNAGGDFDM